ncbi:enoyl-CoA hydratase-related protein [Teredinibacter purpureus]|uniref:enoyl-CoA hydratase-related protein n=1 Tax=Teredinibacter purpureus TaxID=2731756 RepID=UPI0005F7F96A|nr:enoyl-CoA hydratase-related protein [Teredinibacter purpureus]
MRILILASAFSGLCQRVQRELLGDGHKVEEHYDLEPALLRTQLKAFKPDVIVCPFLTQRIPEDVWQQYLCLVVHPGIEGDRGPSSLDWAITENTSEWGVTLLQAEAEMDMGAIWGTQNFPLRSDAKTSIYKREVSSTAIRLIKNALNNISDPHFTPRSLNYDNPTVVGSLRPFMRQPNREINWQTESTASIVQKIHAADTNPGILDTIDGHEIYLFGASPEHQLTGKPGEILAIANGACCRATLDGAVWIRQLKCCDHNQLPAIKLPASCVLDKILSSEKKHALASAHTFEHTSDIRIEYEGDVARIYFDFYNGAASTQQCLDLKNRLVSLKNSDIKCIVFMGGNDFWSNGIHLNCIEASENTALESWQNINAIDDIVKEIIDCPNQLTVAALRNNAGAGGAIMALACDQVFIREGVVLNPHYQTMGLYGSEYWTYLLPKRAGHTEAQKIIRECKPMLAREALHKGLADEMFVEDWDAYHSVLQLRCNDIIQKIEWETFANEKAARRAHDEAKKPLTEYRHEELIEMKRVFDNPRSDYHMKRHNFVYKIKTPRQEAPQNRSLASAAWEVISGRLGNAKVQVSD